MEDTTSHANLAVRHRPTVLEDMVGQSRAVSEIRGMIKRGRVPSTWLLSGDTGCGKTTLARLLSKYLQCKKLVEGSPCGVCVSCRYEGSHPDVVEINMAESRGIDDVRSLIQSSRSMPTIGKYRIFIIDEVHAMTTQAAQAFLKPLEEPPKHTLWILATTNPEKLPATVVGRCSKIAIGLIPPEDMRARLVSVAKTEGLRLKKLEKGEELLTAIVDQSGGHMRDALNMLDKLLSLSADNKSASGLTLTSLMQTADTDLNKASAQLLVAVLGADVKLLISTIRSAANPRGLLSQTRWLVQYHLDNAVGLARYAPYSAKIFATLAKKADLRVNLKLLLKLQLTLLEVEVRFNSMPVDEQVIMLSMLGGNLDV